LDPNLPTFWSSDLPWRYLDMAYEAGVLADVLLRAEPQLRRLAERYEGNPKGFLPARNDLFRRHAKRLGIPWTESESSLSLAESLEVLTTRVRRALLNVAPLIKRALIGGDLPPSARKEVVGFLRVLTSNSPGRPQEDKYRNAAAYCVQHGKKIPATRLCVLFEDDYANMTQGERTKAHDRMRQGISRALKAPQRYRTKYRP